jgi:septal ring factor EnvC (AmiA/AmiB activator)
MGGKVSSEFYNFKFTGKDFIQLGVLLVSLVAFYFSTDAQNKKELQTLETRVTRLETLEESLRRDIQEVKMDVKEILKEVKR